MAFCAECGKSNADQATACDGCGKPMRPAGRAAGPARFKGTMIMGGAAPKAPVAPAPASAPTPAPAPANQPNLAFQATMMGPMTVPGSSAPPPAAAAVAPVAVPPAAATPRVSPKGTMIGGMSALQIPGPPAGQVAASAAPVPQASTFASSETPAAAVDVPPSPAAPQVSSALDVDYGTPGDYGGYGAGANKNNTMIWVGVGIAGAIAFAVFAVGVAVWLGVISF